MHYVKRFIDYYFFYKNDVYVVLTHVSLFVSKLSLKVVNGFSLKFLPGSGVAQ